MAENQVNLYEFYFLNDNKSPFYDLKSAGREDTGLKIVTYEIFILVGS